MADSQTGDLALMRELNERIVLDLIRGAGPISRAELARRSNLSRSTISSIITDLIAANLVQEVGVGSSQGGRRPILLAFNYRSRHAIGLEIAATTLTIALTDLQGTVVRRVQRPISLALGPLACLPLISSSISEALAGSGVPAEQVVGVGVGVPAPLSRSAGRLIRSALLPSWDAVPLQALLERELRLPIILENDANLGALAEQRWGAAHGWQNVAYIYLGSLGIGSGLILDGRIYHGDMGAAGEIGHLTIEADGPLCRCGARGCLEALIGAPALQAQAHAAGLPIAQPDELVALERAGSAPAATIIRAVGTRLGEAVASLLNLLNPGCVIIGGGLASAGEALLGPLRSVLRRRGLAANAEHVAIASGLLRDVVAVGAALAVIQERFLTERSPAISGGRPRAVVL